MCCPHLMHLTARKGSQRSWLPSAPMHLRKNACVWQPGLDQPARSAKAAIQEKREGLHAELCRAVAAPGRWQKPSVVHGRIMMVCGCSR